MATIAGINGKYVYDVLSGANETNNWNPGGQLLSGSLSVGFQYSKNSAEGSTSTPVVTTINAGDTVIIEAGRDINAVGAQVSAGYDQYGLPTGGRGDIALIAGNDINLESAKATSENSSKNVSGGVSIDLLNPGVNFNYGQGKGNDTTLTNINTHVTGSGTVYINSGNDTNLRGATVSGETVIADIGGDLNIESQLDTAKAKANQVNVSGGVGTNAQGQTSGGISGSYQTAKGDAAIVSEQSGIHAGEGGFDIKVDGNTKLTGGLITSEADPENNRLETGTLEFEDLDTHSKWKADTHGGGFGASGPLVSPPIKEGESETGKALSAISPGEIIITDPANQQQNVDDLRRDTTDTNTSLPGIPDLQKLLSEQLKTQQLYDDAAAKAAKMIGDYASDRFAEAHKNNNTEEMEFWKEGGTGPAILHAIAGGLLGGVTDFNGMLSGMLGGAMSAKLAPEIHKLVEQFVKDAGLTGSAADLMVKSITGSILQGLGAATGGTGAAYAGNAYQNNYLKHAEREEFDRTLVSCVQERDPAACTHLNELNTLSQARYDKLDQCIGDTSAECQQARAELRYAAAEYYELARAGKADQTDNPFQALYFGERNTVFLAAAKYADANDTYNFTPDQLKALTDPFSLQIATGSPKEINDALRNPVVVHAIYAATIVGGGPRARGTPKATGTIEEQLAAVKAGFYPTGYRTELYDIAGKPVKWMNPLTGKLEDIPTGVNFHKDHIFPKNGIKNLQDFDMLTPSQQRELLNDPRNFQPLEGSINCSKGCKIEGTPNEWPTYKGQPLDPAYRDWLKSEQENLNDYFQDKISSMLKENGK
ncbi:hemagglutinin repeat-containing protein [Ochrobactrum sp. BTU1]|uniref:hemagglutinin repeat-containing protein n=1 Tax=Ochrobactrum sp. BTU1 TaxID=2840456 RepID=UPI0021110492